MICVVQRVSQASVTVEAGGYHAQIGRGLCVLLGVEQGDGEHVPYPADCFDKWVSVHTVYFWPDLLTGLAEAARVVRPGGELLLAYHPSDNEALAAELPSSVYTLRSQATVESAFREVGCDQIETTTHHQSGVALTRARVES